MSTQSYVLQADGSFSVEACCVGSYFNRTAQHFCSHRHTPADPDKTRPGAVISGKIGYICWRVFEDYAALGSLHLKELVAAMIKKLLPDPSVEVQGLPDRGIVTLTRQDGRLVNHLLFAHTTVRGRNVEVIEDAVPIYDVRVRVKVDRAPEAVTLQPQGTPLGFSYDGGYVSYTVPRLYIHQMITIDL
jgi:hypothetical protein